MLKLVNVTKSFVGSFTPALRALSLDIAQGDFCIIIGCNGSGKSTLMQAIAGEYTLDNGQILINNSDLALQERRALIATVIQDTNKGTISAMTLLENMVLSNLRGGTASLSNYHKYQKVAHEQLAEIGNGLEEYLHKPVHSLSGGQRQMLATLMAVHSAPRILLLDEHTSALAPHMQKLLMEYTARAVNKHKITTLMVTHHLDHAVKYGNRLIMMHAGRVVFDVSGAEKAKLTVAELLTMFHKYEDLVLRDANDS